MKTPTPADVGDLIAEEIWPQDRFRVLEVTDCGTDRARPLPHQQYRVATASGPDLLCAYDVINYSRHPDCWFEAGHPMNCTDDCPPPPYTDRD